MFWKSRGNKEGGENRQMQSVLLINQIQLIGYGSSKRSLKAPIKISVRKNKCQSDINRKRKKY